MDTESSDLGYVEKIDAAVDTAYDGLMVDYHKILGERLAHAIGIWIDEAYLTDVLCDIKYCRHTINDLIRKDEERDRFREP